MCVVGGRGEGQQTFSPDFQEDGIVVSSRERPSLRAGVQTLEYSIDEEEKKEGSGSLGSRKDLGQEVITEAHSESKERNFNEEEGGGGQHVLLERRLIEWERWLQLQTHSDCW